VAIPARRGTAGSATVRIIVLPLHLLGILSAGLLAVLLLSRLIRRRFRAKVLAAATALHESEDGRNA
jgi:hypothetical protein